MNDRSLNSSGRIACPVPRLEGCCDQDIDYSYVARIIEEPAPLSRKFTERIRLICPMLSNKKCTLTKEECPIKKQL